MVIAGRRGCDGSQATGSLPVGADEAVDILLAVVCARMPGSFAGEASSSSSTRRDLAAENAARGV